MNMNPEMYSEPVLISKEEHNFPPVIMHAALLTIASNLKVTWSRIPYFPVYLKTQRLMYTKRKLYLHTAGKNIHRSEGV
jgi:hypothetical protein